MFLQKKQTHRSFRPWFIIAMLALSSGLLACGQAHDGATEQHTSGLPDDSKLDDQRQKGHSDPQATFEDEGSGPFVDEAVFPPGWPKTLALPLWIDRAIDVPIAGQFLAPDDDDTGPSTLLALGFAQSSNGTWERRADLLETFSMVKSDMKDLPNLDAVAVISTFRPFLTEQYLYPTLRSLFAALPASAVINVFVGNGETHYVTPELLDMALGPALSARVHVVETPNEIDQFFSEDGNDVRLKSAWNYARVLRSYDGNKKLLVCEDDIEMVPWGLKELHPYLSTDPIELYFPYTQPCGVTPTRKLDGSKLALAGAKLYNSFGFPTTQAIVFSPSMAKNIADYLSVRVGREPYDRMIGRYLVQFHQTLGFVLPSIVQHRGTYSTGLSSIQDPPHTTCFAGDKKDT